MNHDTGNPETIHVYTITLTVRSAPIQLLEAIKERFRDDILGSSTGGPWEVPASNYEHQT